VEAGEEHEAIGTDPIELPGEMGKGGEERGELDGDWNPKTIRNDRFGGPVAPAGE